MLVYRVAIFLAVALLVISQAFSLCFNCAYVDAYFFDLPLASIGIGFYFFLGVGSFTPWRTWLSHLVFVAAGAHAFWLSTLIQDGLSCLLCFGVAACCLVASISVWKLRKSFVSLSGCILIGVLAARLFTTSIVTEDIEHHPEFQNVINKYSSLNSEHITLLVFSRSDCHICADFWKNDVLKIKQALGGRITINSVVPPNKELPLPTLIVLSAGRTPQVIFGAPRSRDLINYLHRINP